MKTINDAAAATAIVFAYALLPLVATAQDLPTDGDDRPVLGELTRAPLERYYTNPPSVTVETFLQDLVVVWGLEFAPDGRLFLTEKAGRIRVRSRLRSSWDSGVISRVIQDI